MKKMTKEEEDRKYQFIDTSGRDDGWLDRQLRRVEEDVAKWPEWMRERGEGKRKEKKTPGNVIYIENYKNRG